MEDYRVYTPHPRLFLQPRHLRLLKRERERQSLRWNQFESLIRANGALSEPGLALSLHAVVADDPRSAKKAIDWALGSASDLRQLAFVYDWCQEWLTSEQSEALISKITAALKRPAATGLSAQRDRVLAAVAIADDSGHSEQAILSDAVDGWFAKQFMPAVSQGKAVVSPPESYALLEMLHVVRDNLNMDLTESLPEYFHDLPTYLVAANYPVAFAGADNPYRVPVFTGSGQPSQNDAALGRAAGLSLVAFDSNGTEIQFLQGWLIQDRFVMKGALGAPYEFLWANPYQPGLSYFHLPLQFYDARSGILFVRSSWDDEATWLGVYGGEVQLYQGGTVTVLNRKGAPASQPFELGETMIVPQRPNLQFTAETKFAFVVGAAPHKAYMIDLDGQIKEQQSDAAGNLEIQFPPDRKMKVSISIKESPRGTK